VKKKRSPIKSSASRTGSLEAIRRFERGETDSVETFDARGVRTLMVRDSEDRRRFRIESETKDGQRRVTTVGLRLPPSDARPPDFPEGYPFVPGCTTVLLEMAGSGTTALRWEGPDDPVSVFGAVSESLVEDGWTVAESTDPGGRQPRQAFFQRGEAGRKLVVFSNPDRTDVVLMEGRAGTSGGPPGAS
jgi:hypothetical protein